MMPHLPLWPAYGIVDDLFPTMQQWAEAGQQVALATLVHVEGSSPRLPGSEMAINDAGAVVGYVSGGCVESAVATEALACLKDGRPRLLDYGAGSPVLDIQLNCGGRIRILVRPVPDLKGYLTALQKARKERYVVSVLTDCTTGTMCVMRGFHPSTATVFARPHTPPLRLVLVGGDPVVMALLRHAPLYGITPFLIRPHGPANPPEGLPASHYDRRCLPEALKDCPLDEWTALYSLTHTMDDDSMAACHALHSPAFCVGILGSRRKIHDHHAFLQARGLAKSQINRLHLPAGLPLNARTPVEIALSIFAEIMTQRPTPIPDSITRS